MSKPRKAKKPVGWQPKQEVIFAEADNPLYSRAHHPSRSNPVKIKVAVNLKESPLGYLAHRKIINEAQLKAGIEFRRLWEIMGGSGVAAMDYSKDPVDGGGWSDPINARQFEAGKKLNAVRLHIGVRPYEIVQKVAGEGVFLSVLGRSHRERLTYSDYLKDALTDLSILWGFETGKSPQDNRKVVA